MEMKGCVLKNDEENVIDAFALHTLSTASSVCDSSGVCCV